MRVVSIPGACIVKCEGRPHASRVLRVLAYTLLPLSFLAAMGPLQLNDHVLQIAKLESKLRSGTSILYHVIAHLQRAH